MEYSDLIIEQKIFSSSYIERMYIELVESNNIAKYELENFPYEEFYPAGSSKIVLKKNFELILPEGSNRKDLENTKILYDAYQSLTPTQASDPRLWTYLCHVTHWKYMKHRWPLDEAKNPINRIRDRYFLRKLNLEGLTRNGISRLWWYGYLTFDENRKDPWELTNILLSRADLTVGITERGIGCSENIRIAILEFLLENPQIKKNEDLTRELFVKLNLLGGVKNLPFLGIEELKDHLYKIKEAMGVT